MPIFEFLKDKGFEMLVKLRISREIFWQLNEGIQRTRRKKKIVQDKFIFLMVTEISLQMF